MRLLLHTHVLLWWLAGDPKVGQPARTLVAKPTNDVLVSVAALWEIEVKMRIGKLKGYLQDILTEMRNQAFVTYVTCSGSAFLTLGGAPAS